MKTCHNCGRPVERDSCVAGAGGSPTGWIHKSGWITCGDSDEDRRRSNMIAYSKETKS